MRFNSTCHLLVSDMYSRHPVISEIQGIISQMPQQKTTVSFCWIPSHIVISGNEHSKEAFFQPLFTNCVNNLVINERVIHLRYQQEGDSCYHSSNK